MAARPRGGLAPGGGRVSREGRLRAPFVLGVGAGCGGGGEGGYQGKPDRMTH